MRGSTLLGDILKKSIQFIGVMFLLSIIVFYMARLSPGDPLKSYYGEGVERMSTIEKQHSLKKLGLDQPIYIQYIKWVSNSLKGDFGISFKYKMPVSTVIKDVYVNTMILGGLGYILTFILALIMGIFCALNEDKLIDRFICKLGTITNCIPSFWVSLVLILIFSINLGILPTSGAYSMGQESNIANRITHLILPVTVLILSHLWYYAYMIRNKLLEEMREDYVLLCKAKGLQNKTIIYKHCLRSIMPTYISIMAISIPHILGGTYIVEQVFSYPGLGTLCFESAKYHDYNMLLVLSLLTGSLVVLANMIAQVINNKIDPRMKYDRGDKSEVTV
ncbi:MAG: ABC transporter permease [Romboutsia sp.]|uniref:ABC transporter permease n=1 Tax=Romboutsia sp. TaxID=1965302 RepID=UPI003F3A545F